MGDPRCGTKEWQRLEQTNSRAADWKSWGPYLSDRAWGTVREDYSEDGSAWEYFPHDHSRSRAYRWNEDGLMGICDRNQKLCFSLALWNGRDPILKERLFGLTGTEGSHGEDVKEYYYYLDSTPTHSYMKGLYKYPHADFPYQALVDNNKGRPKHLGEYELVHTGVFDEHRYFDVTVEYGKASQEDICIKVTVDNRGPDSHPIHVLPTTWFRNTWSWTKGKSKPFCILDSTASACKNAVVHMHEATLGDRYMYIEDVDVKNIHFCENESNDHVLWGAEYDPMVYPKDSLHDVVIKRRLDRSNPRQKGTKFAPRITKQVPGGGTVTIRLRLTNYKKNAEYMFDDFESEMIRCTNEANEFYAAVQQEGSSDDERLIQRQAFAGLLWSKQFYYYHVDPWISGDEGQPPPPYDRKNGRNSDWKHVVCNDILSMPDKWEYPWFAAWDLAFHCIPLALVDPQFAKRQLIVMLREWYMHPNGQIPAYEWAFGDVNPPVHAWAAWRVYKMESQSSGVKDLKFLARIFHKLLLNFTWWINRKDADGKNVFQGGFLGLDNISLFDRSKPIPDGGTLEQSDGTSWMAMYCLNMLAIALELARHDDSYEDIATKFFEHFLFIAKAMSRISENGEAVELWSETDGFFYDVLHWGNQSYVKLRVKSMVGLIPLFAVHTIDETTLERLPNFKARMEYFMVNRPDLSSMVATWNVPGTGNRFLLALVRGHRMKQILKHMLEDTEFLSEYGIRSLSKEHKDKPVVLNLGGEEHRLDYAPGESQTYLFGGNSNWRGPIWFPVNYLLVDSLQRFHHYYGDDFLVEYPSGSGMKMSLWDISFCIMDRLISIFTIDKYTGKRPVNNNDPRFDDPHWKDLVLFYEYFHGDNGAGLGASHQTGWTGLIAKIIQQKGQFSVAAQREGKAPLSRQNTMVSFTPTRGSLPRSSINSLASMIDEEQDEDNY